MKQNGSFTRYILVWSYARGTLQYDIICALILAFIFIVPTTCFHNKQKNSTPSLSQSSQVSRPENIDKEQRDSNHENK